MAIKVNNTTVIDDSRQLNVTGVSTLGTVKISSGIVTATSGIVTYYGDGQYLEKVIDINLNNSNSNQYIPYALSTGSTAGLGVTTTLVYNPSTSSLGIGITNPTTTLNVLGTVLFTGISTTKPSFYVTNSGNVGFGTTNPTSNVEFKESIRFSAIGSTATENINFVPYALESGALSVENSSYNEQHFSVTNDTSNILFAVNDANANPYIQVSATGVTSITDADFGNLTGVAVGATESEKINISPYREEKGSLSFESAGYESQHFSVTNETSNVLFAVNDADANPIFEVNTSGIVTFTDLQFRKLSGVSVGATAGDVITMYPYLEESGALSFENVVGNYQHLSLTNETGGDIFAVNDDDANPVLQVSNAGVVHSGITTIGLTTTATAPTVNTTMSFELISDTELTIRVKGADGTVRTGIVTLS